jgi:exodeoxyribonuclease VII large subunit
MIPPDVTPLRISELNAVVNELLTTAFPQVVVQGEITGWVRAASGHVYFSLKEGDVACVNCAMWRSQALRLPAGVNFGNGMEVVAIGRLGVYEKSGKYQLYVERMFPQGLGAAEEALRKLKEKLLAKGYFSPDRKRPLPMYPRRIALVTSGRGAAVHDMLEIIARNWPAHDAVVVPVRVQGEGAAEEIAAALDRLNRFHADGSLPLDIIILGRGGGSAEDLAAFNREEVADAIFRSLVPVVSAVGHEIDITISDLVADVRATTPTNAADICTQHWAQVRTRLDDCREAMAAALVARVELARRRLEELQSRKAFRLPLERIREREQRLDELGQRLNGSGTRALTRQRDRIAAYAGRLAALSPLNVLARGYSLTQSPDGKLLRDAAALRVGDALVSRFLRGRVESIATAIIPAEDPK